MAARSAGFFRAVSFMAWLVGVDDGFVYRLDNRWRGCHLIENPFRQRCDKQQAHDGQRAQQHGIFAPLGNTLRLLKRPPGKRLMNPIREPSQILGRDVRLPGQFIELVSQRSRDSR